jgi:hypothetical protein
MAGESRSSLGIIDRRERERESGDQDCLPERGLTATRRHSQFPSFVSPLSVIRSRCAPQISGFEWRAGGRGEKGESAALAATLPGAATEGRVINAANTPRISPAPGFDTRARVSRRELIARGMGRMLIASNGRFLDFDGSVRAPDALPSSSMDPG